MVERRAYVCDEAGCEAWFPVDENDPMVAHGAYMDHQAEHDAELEADEDPEADGDELTGRVLYDTPTITPEWTI